MSALAAPFDVLPPAGASDRQIWYAILRQLGGGAGVTPGGAGSLVVSDPDSAPAENAAAVTPGAGALSNTTRALYIGVAGDITVTMAGGGSVSFAAVPAGTVLPIAVTHVTAATATSIVALW